ncbi:hypothetical protein [Burkholderia pseudomultivorans]|uniref:Uncharacterized protein n=1 Tax=Burkholderia pseudomultivorans TaxID=1207504 RepID=A0A132EIU3_9BURK|nr:hypothetical protein [Burkholderia pseudomultivorans]KWF30875.1 hypothetical protein WT56_12775 [Burkholderia pseudomultivorans]
MKTQPIFAFAYGCRTPESRGADPIQYAFGRTGHDIVRVGRSRVGICVSQALTQVVAFIEHDAPTAVVTPDFPGYRSGVERKRTLLAEEGAR